MRNKFNKHQEQRILVEQHNARQRTYYESALDKPTMQIRETPYLLNHVARMITCADLRRDHLILEIGAGLGKYSNLLIKNGLQLTCNDLSPVMLDLLRQKVGSEVDTIAGDVSNLHQLTDRLFDRVIGFFTLHHLLDLGSAFTAIAQTLNPGGKVYFIEPRAYHPLFFFQIALSKHMSFAAEKGIANMSPSKIFPVMRQAGIVPFPAMNYGFCPEFVVNTRWGSKTETLLNDRRWLRWAAVFTVFGGQKGGS